MLNYMKHVSNSFRLLCSGPAGLKFAVQEASKLLATASSKARQVAGAPCHVSPCIFIHNLHAFFTHFHTLCTHGHAFPHIATHGHAFSRIFTHGHACFHASPRMVRHFSCISNFMHACMHDRLLNFLYACMHEDANSWYTKEKCMLHAPCMECM